MKKTKHLRSAAFFGVLLLGVILISGCTKGSKKEAFAEIYAKYNEAVKNFDREKMKKYVSSAQREELNQFPEELSQLSEDEREFVEGMIEWMKSEATEDYKVVGQKIELDEGSLYLERKKSDMPYGLVTFVKENGTWKIEEVLWSNKPKN